VVSVHGFDGAVDGEGLFGGYGGEEGDVEGG
jgi:hypothetical protein